MNIEILITLIPSVLVALGVWVNLNSDIAKLKGGCTASRVTIMS